VDMSILSTPLLLEDVSGVDADSVFLSVGEGSVGQGSWTPWSSASRPPSEAPSVVHPTFLDLETPLLESYTALLRSRIESLRYCCILFIFWVVR